MLPPTSVFFPLLARISPTRVVVVVLPLEPVIASTLPCRKRNASSTSPITGNSQRARVLQLRLVRRNAGAYDDQVLVAEGAFAVLACLNGDAAIQQRGNFALQLGLALGVGNNDPGAMLL